MSSLSAQSDFFSHLRAAQTHHVFLTAETDDFDEATTADWQDEGFKVTYVPLGDGGNEYIRRLHDVARDVVGVSDRYAIIGKCGRDLRLMTGLFLGNFFVVSSSPFS